MTIRFLEPFVADYQHLHPRTRKKVDRITSLLKQDIRHPGIRAKKLVNHPDIWEARVDLHTRLTFHIIGDALVFRHVGTHDIYRNP